MGRKKRRGTNSGRYGRSSGPSATGRARDRYSPYIEEARQRNKDKKLKKKNPKKYKRRKQIAKFSADGKITKREGRKLAKKGVSLQKIRNRNISEYRRASRNDDSVRFEPLKIKRGAAEATRGNRGRTDKPKPKPQRNNNSGGSKPTQVNNNYGQTADDLLKEIDGGTTTPTTVDDVLGSTPQSIYDKSTRTDGKELKLNAADRARKMGTKAFKRRRTSRAAKRRRQMRINKSLNL